MVEGDRAKTAATRIIKLRKVLIAFSAKTVPHSFYGHALKPFQFRSPPGVPSVSFRFRTD